MPLIDPVLGAGKPDSDHAGGHPPGHAGGARFSRTAGAYVVAVAAALLLAFAGTRTPQGIELLDGNLPYAFVLFVLVLLGVALFHAHTLHVALGGVVAITLYTALLCPGFAWPADRPPGLWGHFLHEGEHTLLNLGGLLLGFALLADHFERSGVPDHLPRLLPRRPAVAAMALLGTVWLLSSFLDNIAAAMIGGVIAARVFHGNVTVGFVAAIVAASNAGGAWSVLGDTTTTMMWIEGVSPGMVLDAMLASATALLVFGIPAARRQVRLHPPAAAASGPHAPIDTLRLLNVLLVLAGAVVTNVLLDRPFVGVWAALLVGSLWRAPSWRHLPGAAKSAAFLLSLVWCASLMPVQALPPAGPGTALGLGFVSAVFDNIPLTKLALEQGGYDWGVLSYAVGFGGSMLWFGSSAGVAIAAAYPNIRHTGRYLLEGWPVAVAYVIGYLALLWAFGWHPVPIAHGS